MNVPDDIRLRPGSASYLNIDNGDTEIGHLQLAPDGQVIRSWAIHMEDRNLITLVRDCYQTSWELLQCDTGQTRRWVQPV